MKKIVLLSAVMLVVFSSIGQQIPNGGFESWVNKGLYSDPEFWTTPNATTAALFITTVEEETTDPYEGTSSAKLTTVSAMAGLYTIPGFMTLGKYSFNLLTQEVNIYGGIAFPYKPKKLLLYYKYQPVNGDNWFISVEFFTRDSLTGDKTTVGGNSMKIYDSADTWTLFELPLNFKPGLMPDSLNINILSSNTDTPQAGSVLVLDKMYFDMNTSVGHPVPGHARISVFPNPANDKVMIYSETAMKEVQLLDINSRVVNKIMPTGQKAKLDLTGLDEGIYFLKVYTTAGKITVKKIIVQD